jgi:hypothetical protein
MNGQSRTTGNLAERAFFLTRYTTFEVTSCFPFFLFSSVSAIFQDLLCLNGAVRDEWFGSFFRSGHAVGWKGWRCVTKQGNYFEHKPQWLSHRAIWRSHSALWQRHSATTAYVQNNTALERE